ncbi:autotransporter-associated beta strand repeat-containing protein [Bradyrhizobium erythrophlei]|uniref:Autotransporter-associated beta strand repeat-containing protein n=1 Tax=Bradyrhizobium erythrophlei TaxID=1437360 RepID=A0A1M7U288_9BRAD|nr:autotransporter-associated beta strand repeat-containing protein [Bradyrhizobium erythrophlei]SHN77109.1 autotransporter-associated beta strand repeat-containing protein [Bradyrhizobium erythrophlei]
MNYFGKFDATVSDALGQHPGAHLYSEKVHAAHVPSDAVVVPDAELLFRGDFKRAGVDLVLSGDGHEYVVHDYFKGQKHAPLAATDGAFLTGDIVNALAGQVQIAQAGGAAGGSQVIGHVTKLVGTATATRNGVSIILNNGDNVEKGDVVQSGADSTLGITFIDGTVFGLSSNSRMVLNEMVYDPNGSNNSSLLSLVAGTITFVAGETAKHGDMKVDTPVATMGIRGTAVLVEIDFALNDAKFQVLVEPDGTTGSYILFDKTTLTPLAVVDKAGQQINISNGLLSQTTSPLSPEIQKLITDVFSLKFSDSTSTKALEHFTDSIIPTPFGIVKVVLVNSTLPQFTVTNALAPTSGPPANNGANISHIAEAPFFTTVSDGKITELPVTTGSSAVDKTTGTFNYFDVNASDHPTVSVSFASFSYTQKQPSGQVVDITAKLNALELADIKAVENAITVTQGTFNSVGNGTASYIYKIADGAFDFLAANETLTLTFNATVDNNYLPADQTGSQTFTITITGSNDVPKFTSPQQNITFAPAGHDTSGGNLFPDTATNGTLAFTDPDLTDTHTPSVEMTSALLNGQPLSEIVGADRYKAFADAVTVKITTADDSTGTGTGQVEWTLADLEVYLADLVPDGEKLILTYTVTVTDSQGATSQQNIVVTIEGNQPAVTAWIDINPIPDGGAALWSDAANWESDLAPTKADDVFIGNDQVNPKAATFPVTVDADAQAKSLSMNDFSDGIGSPTLHVNSGVTLAISGDLNLNTSTATDSHNKPLVLATAQAIIDNYGTITVGGIAELLKSSVLDNYGSLVLSGGGDFKDQTSVTNAGTIEIADSSTFNVAVDIQNSYKGTNGTLQIDQGATLKILDGVDSSGHTVGTTISDGKVTIAGGGTLDVESGKGVTLNNVEVDGTNAASPDPASLIEVGKAGAATLVLENGTKIENGALKVFGGSTLDIESSAGATLDDVSVIGVPGVPESMIKIGAGSTLVLDDGTIVSDGKVTIAGDGTLDVAAGTSGAGATLDNVTVSGGNVTVDPGVTLTLDTVTLDGVTLSGGTDDATAVTVSADSTIKNATVTGDITTDPAVTLTLDTVTLDGVTLSGGTDDATAVTVSADSTIKNATVTGDITTDPAVTLTLNTVTLDGVTLSGGTDDATAVTVSADSTIKNATVTGDITTDPAVTLTLDTVTLDGVTLSGGTDAATAVTVSADSTIKNATVTGDITTDPAVTLTLDTVTLDGVTLSGGTDDATAVTVSADSTIKNATVTGDITTDPAVTLTLNTVTLDGVTLSGGTDDATAVTVSADSTIKNATVTGDITTDPAVTLTLDTVTLDGVTLSGGTDAATAVTVSADSTIKNATVTGDITTDPAVTLTLNTVTLDGVTLSGGTDDATAVTVSADSTIKNATVTGGITTDPAVTLTLDTVTLDGVTLSGGTDDATAVTVSADSTIKNATVTGDITTDPAVTLTLNTVTLDGVTLSGGTDDATAVTVSADSTIKNATVTGDITTDPAVTLTLDTVTLDGVTLSGGTDDATAVTVSADSTIKNATVTGDITTDPAVTLTLDTVTLDGVTLSGGTDDATAVTVSADSTIKNATVTGDITTDPAVTLTLDTVTLDGVTLSGGTDDATAVTVSADSTIKNATVTGDITTDPAVTLTLDTVTLDGVTLSGGTDDATAVTVSADSTIKNATVTGGITTDPAVTLTLNTVTLDGVTLSGGTDDATAVTVSADSTIKNATVTGGITTDPAVTLTLDTVTLDGVTLSGGTDDATAVTVSADSTIKNATVTGDITTDPAAALTLDTVTLDGVTLSGGTDDATAVTVSADSTIKNATVTGGITTDPAVTLTLNTVTLDGVTLSGGTDDATAVTVSADSTIKNATVTGGITTDPAVTLTLDTVTLDGVTLSGGTDDATAVTVSADSTIKNATVTGGITTDPAVTLTLDTVTLDGVTLSGGTIDDVGSIAGFGTIGSAITGSGALTASGGTLTLTGDNTYSGVTTITGTLVLSGSGSIADSSGVIDDGTFDISGLTSGTSIVTLSGNSTGKVILGNNTLTLTAGVGIFSGVISGSGGLTVDGTGTETLTGINTFGGATTIGSGETLALTGTGSIAASSGLADNGTFDITGLTASGASITTLSGNSTGKVHLGGKTLTLTNANDTFSGVIDGTGGGLILTTGTETLTGTNTYTGATTINGGTLALSGTGSIATSSGVADNGTFNISGLTSSTSIVTLSGNSTGKVILGNNTLTLTAGVGIFSGVISGSGGLTVDGTGTETLTGINTFGGATTIGSGETLALTGTGSIAASSGLVDNGTFDITGLTASGASITTLSGNSTGKVHLGGKTLTLTNANDTFSGVIDGTGGGLILTTGTGTETLTGTNTYTGVTTINGGTLALSGTGSIATSSGVADNGTFNISGLTSGTSIVTLSGNSTGKVILGNNTLTLTAGVGIFSGVISGSGGLTVDGTGTETLTGINTFGGTTTIGSGETLALTGTGSIAASSGLADNGTFDITGLTASGASITTLSGNSTGKVHLGGKTLTLTNANDTFSGVIDGTGGGLILTTGTETLTGTNTYTGVTTINGGTLALSGTGSIATSSGVADNGTFNISGLTSGTSIVTLSGNSTGKVILGNNTLTLTAGVGIFSGVISGSGGLTVDGTGTETLTGINTFGGTTTIGSGETLALTGTGSIAASSGLADNGTFDITGLTASGASITTLSGNSTGKVHLGGKTLTLTNANDTFSGVIDGTGGGLILTTGTETLTGTNTYTGVTTINGGTLALKGSGSIAHSSDVIDDGTFDISATTSGASIVTLSGNGALTLGAETLTLTNASTTFSGTISSTDGGITVASGTLTLGTMTLDDLTLAGSFSNSGTLTIVDTVTFNGVTMSGGTLDVSGILDTTGTTTISGASIINPGHIVQVSGTLTIDPTPFTNTGTFEVQSSAVFSGEVHTDTHGNVTSIDQEVVTNTNGTIQIDHGGTLTLFDATINGGTIIDNGTLLLTGTTSKLENVTFTGTATLDVASGATLELGGSGYSGVTVNFGTPGPHGNVVSTSGLLILDDSHHFGGTISGLTEASSESQENHVDLTDLHYDPSQSAHQRVAAVDSNGEVTVTVTDAHGHTLDQVSLAVSGNSSGSFETSSDGHGGVLLDDPSTTGNVTIDSDQTLSISAASSNTVTFTNNSGTTGELLLADSKDFTGSITGFTGDGTVANSDLIDVTDINFANVATDKTTYTENAAGTGGTLTLHDANGQALDSINFTGNYQLANFTIENDGSGGTLIVDPPVDTSSPTPTNTVVASGPNQVLSGSAPGDNFVFNFAGVGHSTITNFDPAADAIKFSSSIFANAQSILNATHDDGHGNAIIAIDAHDSITLNGVLKAQLHASDFHVV